MKCFWSDLIGKRVIVNIDGAPNDADGTVLGYDQSEEWICLQMTDGKLRFALSRIIAIVEPNADA